MTCGWPLTIEHHAGKIFWSDYCTYRIESLDINGSNYSIIVNINYNHFVTFHMALQSLGTCCTGPSQLKSTKLTLTLGA